MNIILLTGNACSGKSFVAGLIEEKHEYKIRRLDFDFTDPDLDRQKELLIERTKAIAPDVLRLWFEPQIIYPIYFIEQLVLFTKRNYCLLANVKSPQQQRRERFKKKYPNLDMDVIDDKLNFELHRDIIESRSDFQIYNTDVERLLDFFKNEPRIGLRKYRPDWDEYFMKIAHVVRQRSNCMKRSVGAIVVVDNQIISTGYNGTPSALKNCCDFGCARCNENISQGKHLDKCRCIHAEENSLLFCGITRAKGGTVYVTLFPCLWCAKIIVQAKIARVVYDEEYNPEYSGLDILRDGGVVVEKCPLVDLSHEIPNVKQLLGWEMEEEHSFKIINVIGSQIPAIQALTKKKGDEISSKKGEEEESKVQADSTTDNDSQQQELMATTLPANGEAVSTNKVEEKPEKNANSTMSSNE